MIGLSDRSSRGDAELSDTTRDTDYADSADYADDRKGGLDVRLEYSYREDSGTQRT